MKKIVICLVGLFILSPFVFAASKGKIVFGTDPTFAPFEFYDENNELVGFDIDIANALAEKAGYSVEFKNVKINESLATLTSDKVKAVISGMVITADKEQQAKFLPYLTSGLSVIVDSDLQGIKDISGLENKKIAVKNGSFGQILASSVHGAEIFTFETDEEMEQAILNKNVVAIINDTPINDYFLREKSKGRVQNAFEVGKNDNKYSIAIKNDNEKLFEDLTIALKTIKEDGTYNAITSKWFGKKFVNN